MTSPDCLPSLEQYKWLLKHLPQLTRTTQSHTHIQLVLMSHFAPAPAPPTKLGIYRVLSARAGVHVSPLCLGAMSIGDKWGSFMGSMDKEASFKLLDAYFDKAGNFIDTANA